jgi:glycosyltransferase XagB
MAFTSPPVIRETAQNLISRGQLIFTMLCLGALIGNGLWNLLLTLQIMVAAGVIFVAYFVTLKVVLGIASSRYHFPIPYPLDRLRDEDLPVYTVFIPLYNEPNMIPSLVKAIEKLDYPKDKLQVMLLLEEDDTATRKAANEIGLPSYFEIVIAPPHGPKTKPKACNIGLANARGKYCVIFDAEDRPEPQQLKKAVARFKVAQPDVVCLQAQLRFWNGDSSWVSRFYAADYLVHYLWMLRGMCKLGLVPQLGGTSNHFVTEKLREVAIAEDRLPEGAAGIGGWDPWNVTEDAELGSILAKHRYRVQMLDSVTLEEAPSYRSARPELPGKRRLCCTFLARVPLVRHLHPVLIIKRNWRVVLCYFDAVAFKQRRRWLKGYGQSGLVHSRRPIRTIRQMGLKNYVVSNTILLGTPLSYLLNPLFWGMTITYAITRSNVIPGSAPVAAFIESLFPTPIFYIGIVAMVAGNFLLFYQLMMACLKGEEYGSVKFMFLAPVFWVHTTASAFSMLFALMRPKTRSLWDKSGHGHDLNKELALEEELEHLVQAEKQQGIA